MKEERKEENDGQTDQWMDGWTDRGREGWKQRREINKQDKAITNEKVRKKQKQLRTQTMSIPALSLLSFRYIDCGL